MACKQCGKDIPKRNKFCSSSCAAIYNNSHRTRSAESRKKTARSVKSFYEQHPEYGERQRQRLLGTKKTLESRLKQSESLRARYKAHPIPSKYTAEQLIYLNREHVARAKAKKLGLLPQNAEQEQEAIVQFYLNTPGLDYSVDHIIPFAKGGQHTLSNLQYLTIEENCYVKNAK